MWSWLTRGFRQQREMTRQYKQHMSRYIDTVMEICSLPDEEARRRFWQEVDGGEFFRVKSTHAPLPAGLGPLAPSARDFFSSVEEVELIKSNHIFRRDAIEPYGAEFPDFVLLGYQIDGAEIVMSRSHEGIYQLGDHPEPDDLTEASFPTLYHWMLCDPIEFGEEHS